MMEYKPDTAARIFKMWWIRQLYHRAEISGTHNLPRQGPALLVSNHGRLDSDVLILMKLIWENCGRVPRGMGDRSLFRMPVFRFLAPLAGAVEGNRENAVSLLQQDEMLMVYPGGYREVTSSRFGVDDIYWNGRTGFAQVALRTQSPVIPIAGLGINNGHLFLTSGKLLGKILFQGIFRLGPDFKEYRDPLTIGLIPFPLPFSLAVNFPLPCKLHYVVGEAIQPEFGPEAADDPEKVKQFADQVAAEMRRLLRKNSLRKLE